MHVLVTSSFIVGEQNIYREPKKLLTAKGFIRQTLKANSPKSSHSANKKSFITMATTETPGFTFPFIHDFRCDGCGAFPVRKKKN